MFAQGLGRSRGGFVTAHQLGQIVAVKAEAEDVGEKERGGDAPIDSPRGVRRAEQGAGVRLAGHRDTEQARPQPVLERLEQNPVDSVSGPNNSA